MAFSMFQAQGSPIAIDFGTASVKLLQLSPGERPEIAAAAELPVPDAIRGDAEKLFDYYAEFLPPLLAKAGFKGRRAVLGLPSSRTLVHHMQVPPTDGATTEDLVKGQLQAQFGYAPEAIVVRTREVPGAQRFGQQRNEVICFAIARSTVMQHVGLLDRLRITIAGVHTGALALVHALAARAEERKETELVQLVADVGWGGTQVLVMHGRHPVLGRFVPFGGRHLDQAVAAAVGGDLHSARQHRLRDAAPSSPGAATAVADPQYDLAPTAAILADELGACLRYHRALFVDRAIDRLVFHGGEARQDWLCREVAVALQLPAWVADPLHGLRLAAAQTPGVDLRTPQPGWAVPFGLCVAPTDL